MERDREKRRRGGRKEGQEEREGASERAREGGRERKRGGRTEAGREGRAYGGRERGEGAEEEREGERKGRREMRQRKECSCFYFLLISLAGELVFNWKKSSRVIGFSVVSL